MTTRIENSAAKPMTATTPSSTFVPTYARQNSFTQIIYNTFTPPGPDSPKEDQEMWHTAQDFEAQTIAKFMEDWLSTTDSTKEFDERYQEGMFNSEMAKAYANDVVRSGGTNLASKIYEDMQRHKKDKSADEGYIA